MPGSPFCHERFILSLPIGVAVKLCGAAGSTSLRQSVVLVAGCAAAGCLNSTSSDESVVTAGAAAAGAEASCAGAAGSGV
jgi:hypothetical protein